MSVPDDRTTFVPPHSASAQVVSPAAPSFLSKQVVQSRVYYFKSAPKLRAELAVGCVGWEKCAPDYVIDRLGFPFLGMEFVGAGRGKLTLAGRTYELQPGSLFSYAPGVPHRIVNDPRDPLEKYFVDFTGTRGAPLLTQLGLKPGTCRVSLAVPELRDAFEHLLRLSGQLGTHTARACALQLELLLIATKFATGTAVEGERRALATFERCRRNMEEYFLRYRTAEQVAAACRVNIFYLCRLYKRFSGLSPYQYLVQLRMKWAANQLHGTDRLIREVADELGIDAFQFSRAFKRVHGVSPTVFLESRRVGRTR